MKKNSFSRTLIPLLILPITTFVKAKSDSQPNILLICVDDMGWSDLGCYGSEIKTPNLDRLAQNGLRFTQFHNSSKSYPSRASLLTGLYAQQNGYAVDHTLPLKNSVTLGEVLRSAGYRTLWSGKHHGIENPIYRGFDRYYGLRDGACNYFNPGKQREGEGKPAQKRNDRAWCIDSVLYQPYTPPQKDFYTTDYFTHQALKWLNEYNGENKPFFLYLAYNAPHDPLMAWSEDIEKYKDTYRVGYEKIRNQRFKKQQSLGLISNSWKLSNPTYTPWDDLTEQQQNLESLRMAVYAAMIDRVDQNIGRLLDWLRSNNKLDNTLILFVSDNGGSAEVVELPGSGEIGSMTRWESLKEDWANVSNTPFRHFKNHSFEGGICTPMIAFWPQGMKSKGQITNYCGHFIDIMPTLCELAGANYPKEYNNQRVLPMEGESFLKVISSNKKKREKPLFWQFGNGAATRFNDWKIVRMKKTDNWELYDMKNDATETNNLAKKHPDKVKKLAQMYIDWDTRVSID